MKDALSRALVQVRARLPSVLPAREEEAGHTRPYTLVRTDTWLKNHAQVRQLLPDILGRALARAWIDPGFRASFSDDPKATLEVHGVHLPHTISITCETEGVLRPKVVVYEDLPRGGGRRRMLYLQLVMMAGK